MEGGDENTLVLGGVVAGAVMGVETLTLSYPSLGIYIFLSRGSSETRVGVT